MLCPICIRLLTGVATAVLLAVCGGNSTPTPPPVLNPTPSIAALSLNSIEQGGSSFTLSVVGSNFVAGTSIRWNASDLQTTFQQKASQLFVAVPVSITLWGLPDAVSLT